MDNNLITLKEYAEMHGVTPSTVRHRIRRGSITAVKLGRDWFIDKDEPYDDGRYKNGQYVGFREKYRKKE